MQEQRQVAISCKTNTKHFFRYTRNKMHTNNKIVNFNYSDSSGNPSIATKNDEKCKLNIEFFTSVFTKETEFNEND